VRYVVDAGFVKARGYNAKLGAESLQVRWGWAGLGGVAWGSLLVAAVEAVEAWGC
jgi:hypothetical protein